MEDIDEKMQELIDTIQPRFCNDFCIDGGLRFKSKDYYLSNDGYPLNTTVWYFRVKIYGMNFRIFGSCPVNLIDNAIAFFKDAVAIQDRQELHSQIKDFREQQLKKAPVFGKNINQNLAKRSPTNL